MKKRLNKSGRSWQIETFVEARGSCGTCMNCNPSACVNCYGNESTRWVMYTASPGSGVEENYRTYYGM